MQTIMVTDDPDGWSFLSQIAPIVIASDYISEENVHHDASIRVINLCKSYQFQTIGYYVSLLATARDHKVIPAVGNIQDVLSNSLIRQISSDIDDEIQDSLKEIKTDEFVFSLYFGQNVAKKYAGLAKKLHGLFPLPMLRFTLERKKTWQIKKLQTLALEDVPAHHYALMQEAALSYFSKKRFYPMRKKQHFHDLAILVDPNEPNPPSDQAALELFVTCGAELGLQVDLIDKNDGKTLAEYDALFIRATTSVDHYTYRLARRAIQENMVVIDDPQSIVRCSNKVYLAELLRSHQILTPDTLYLNKFDNELPRIQYPCVLKRPDGAFSKGVVKIDSEKALEKSISQFFKTSDIVLIQPFIPTEFDWRIGVLDNQVIFACRYYMAQGHWQIYNWASAEETMGRYDSLPVSAVPENVIKTALKATKLIGDSLYGVDIKSHGDKHYVIEVNDNPSIDTGIEDALLGKELYQHIMRVFMARIRRNHGYV